MRKVRLFVVAFIIGLFFIGLALYYANMAIHFKGANPTPEPKPTSNADITIDNSGRMLPNDTYSTTGNFAVDVSVTITDNGYAEGFNASSTDFLLTAGYCSWATFPSFRPISGFGTVFIPIGENYTGTLVFQLPCIDVWGSFNGLSGYGWYLNYSTSDFYVIMVPQYHINS